MNRSGAVLFSAFLLTGCVFKPIDPQLEASAAFQTGYADGCATGTARSKAFDRTTTRDETAYREDEAYRRGWNSGFRGCGSPATQRDPYGAPVGDWKSHGPLN